MSGRHFPLVVQGYWGVPRREGRGQKLGYFYYEEGGGRRWSAKMLTKDAQRIAADIAKLPQLLVRS